MRTALVLLLSVVITACGPTFEPAGAIPLSPSPRPASAPRIAPAPVTPTAPGDKLPAFSCSNVSGGKTGVANVMAARMAEQPGYDRFVLQFDSTVPSYTVQRQARPVFLTEASGQSISLSGIAGVLVQVHSATGAGTFTGPTDMTHTEYLVLREARQTEDFEGYVAWGLGLSQSACMRVFTLSDPARLVVDFNTAAS